MNLKRSKLTKAYVDGELGPKTNEQIKPTLEDQAELDAFAQIGQAIASAAPVIHPPVDGAEKLIGNLRANPAPPQAPRIPFLRLAAFIAPVAGCLVLALAVNRSRQDASLATSLLQRPVVTNAEIDPQAQSSGSPQDAEDSLSIQKPVSPSAQSDVVAAPAPAARSKNLIARSAGLNLEVLNVIEAENQIEAFVKLAGGYLGSTTIGEQAAQLTLQVPANSADGLKVKLRTLGKVLSENSISEDVTSDTADTEARLKVMRAEEDQITKLLSQAKSVGQTLAIRDRLTAIRSDIESLEAEEKSLANRVKFTTLTVDLNKVQPPFKTPPTTGGFLGIGGSLGSALASLVSVVAAIGIFLLYVLVFAPLWLPVVWLSFWSFRQFQPSYRR